MSISVLHWQSTISALVMNTKIKRRDNCGFRGWHGIHIQISWFTRLYHLHSVSACPLEAQFSTVCTALDWMYITRRQSNFKALKGELL